MSERAEALADQVSELYAENQRLRERIHEVQTNADRRNAELHRKVAYYESIRDRTNALLERFLTKTPSERHPGAVNLAWDHSWVLPGSEISFWVAFQMVLEADEARLSSEASPGRSRTPLKER